MGTLPDGIIRAMFGNPDTGIWEIWNPEKSLPVETKIHGLWDLECSSRNPESH